MARADGSPHRRHLRAVRRQADQASCRGGPAIPWRWRELDAFATGETLSTAKSGGARAQTETLTPVYRLAIAAQDRKDEVKLTAAIAKLREEDPSLAFEQNAETQEMILAGQGEIHLKVAVEKLRSAMACSSPPSRRRCPITKPSAKAPACAAATSASPAAMASSAMWCSR